MLTISLRLRQPRIVETGYFLRYPGIVLDPAKEKVGFAGNESKNTTILICVVIRWFGFYSVTLLAKNIYLFI